MVKMAIFATGTWSPLALMQLLIMSVAFSLDTVLTVTALTDVFLVVVFATVALDVPMAVISGLMACVFEHNRMCEVLGLFALLLVGIMLTSKTRHPVLCGCEVELMSRGIFYFVPFTAMLTDVVQRRRLH